MVVDYMVYKCVMIAITTVAKPFKHSMCIYEVARDLWDWFWLVNDSERLIAIMRRHWSVEEMRWFVDSWDILVGVYLYINGVRKH